MIADHRPKKPELFKAHVLFIRPRVHRAAGELAAVSPVMAIGRTTICVKAAAAFAPVSYRCGLSSGTRRWNGSRLRCGVSKTMRRRVSRRAARPTFTVVAGTLQKAGLIKYRHGRVTIVDREHLEAASCEYYRTATDLLKSVTEGSRSR